MQKLGEAVDLVVMQGVREGEDFFKEVGQPRRLQLQSLAGEPEFRLAVAKLNDLLGLALAEIHFRKFTLRASDSFITTFRRNNSVYF